MTECLPPYPCLTMVLENVRGRVEKWLEMECRPGTKFYSTQFQISKLPSFPVQCSHFVVFVEDAQTGEGGDAIENGRNGVTNKLEKETSEYIKKEMGKINTELRGEKGGSCITCQVVCEARAQQQASICGICGAQSGTWTGLTSEDDTFPLSVTHAHLFPHK